jgi:hypothetical protein
MLASKAMRCFTDDSGLSRIDVAPLPDTVASFLELDIRGSVQSTDELLAQVDRILNGEVHRWEAAGETFAITLGRDGASINCVWGDDNCKLSLADFRQCLVAWRVFIREPPTQQSGK